jgi:hypothetical protein
MFNNSDTIMGVQTAQFNWISTEPLNLDYFVRFFSSKNFRFGEIFSKSSFCSLVRLIFF